MKELNQLLQRNLPDFDVCRVLEVGRFSHSAACLGIDADNGGLGNLGNLRSSLNLQRQILVGLASQGGMPRRRLQHLDLVGELHAALQVSSSHVSGFPIPRQAKSADQQQCQQRGVRGANK